MLAGSEVASPDVTHDAHTTSRLGAVLGIAATCLGLVALAYVAVRSQPRPPSVYLDDAWPLIGWKVERLIDFRRAAYTAPGFLALERLWLELVSFSTVRARWLPLLFTLAIGPGFLLVALRMRIRFFPALLGAVLLVTSPELVSMATHVKQYSLDVLLAIAVIGVSAGVLREPAAARRWIAFAAVSVVALVASFASVGVVAAGTLAGLLALVRDAGSTKRAKINGVVAAGILGIFAIGWYVVVLRPIIPFEALTDFWRGSYLDTSSFKHSWMLVYLFFQAAFAVPVMLALVVLGAATALVIARRPLHAVLFGVPVVLAVLASFARQVPFGSGRTDTWLYVPIVMMVVSAADLVLEHADRRHREAATRSTDRIGTGIRIAVAVAAVLVIAGFVRRDFPGGHDTYGYGIYPIQANVSSLVPKLETQRRPGDLVVVAFDYTFSYPLYAPQGVRTEPTDTNVAGWYPVLDGVDVLMDELERDLPGVLPGRLEGVQNVWVLDAPKDFNALGSDVRSVLTEHGFEEVGRERSEGGVLEHWRRIA